VALESVGEAVGVVGLDGEDFDGQVGGAGCEAAAVVVEDSIVLWQESYSQFIFFLVASGDDTYDHVLVARVGYYLRLEIC
jgi:hypothetical protein